MKKIRYMIMLLAISGLFCQCKYDVNSRLTTYIEANECQIDKLRNWTIFYEPERDFWSCRHWYNRDSLLAFMLVSVDKYNNIISYDIGSLHEDSITMVQRASQNISILYEIREIFKSESIGTHEVELFVDTLAYDYVINVREKEIQYQIMLMKSENDTIGRQLYRKWYIRELTRKD